MKLNFSSFILKSSFYYNTEIKYCSNCFSSEEPGQILVPSAVGDVTLSVQFNLN